MKTTTLVLILFLTCLNLSAQPAHSPRRPPRLASSTNAVTADAVNASTTPGTSSATGSSVPDASPAAEPPAANTSSAPDESEFAEEEPGMSSESDPAIIAYNFQGVEVSQVLDVYASLVGRTILRANLPQATIILKTQSPLTKSEAIQALQAVLALNNISVVNAGEKFIKVLPSEQANSAGAPLDRSDMSKLPEMGTYVTHIVQLKYTKPTEMLPIIQPFAKLPNSILTIEANGIMVLRDYAENVKRMLEMIQQVDVSVPAEYISEVIPIRYAQAEDICSALNSLGGGGSTVSIGSSGAGSTISGISRPSGVSSMQGVQSPGGYNQNQPNQPRLGAGASSSQPGGTFSDRLNKIINRAAGSGGQQDQIQLFGQTKIIADQRSNSLLVFATRRDMEMIKNVISKLDVLLAQVLIEAVIMDVSIGHSWNLGVSAAQNPKTFQGHNTNSPINNIIGGGGMNNGQSFFDFLNNSFNTTNSSSTFGNNLPSGFSYFGNIGPNWNVAVQAAESDNTATIIQRPRIQTSQAKQAQFFVGQTVPYVTGNSYYGGGYGSSYSQLSVGIELDVTPFINPDGLVVMSILQQIDEISGYTVIENVGKVPNTTKRTLSSEISVRDRDTIILGGFIRSDKTKTKSGVPLLMDIPLLGNLFTSRSDTKSRSEMIVMMRPTVLRTPEIASEQTIKEQKRLPGVSAALKEDAAYENNLIEAQRKAELRRSKIKGRNRSDSFYPPMPPSSSTDNNAISGYSNTTSFIIPPFGVPMNTNTTTTPNP